MGNWSASPDSLAAIGGKGPSGVERRQKRREGEGRGEKERQGEELPHLYLTSDYGPVCTRWLLVGGAIRARKTAIDRESRSDRPCCHAHAQ